MLGLLAILWVGGVFFPMGMQAQLCNPDPSLTAPGIYPDTLLPVCAGVAFAETITFIVPVDTTVNVPPFGIFTLPIDSITLDDVINVPTGMSYGCNPGTCVFPGNSSNCILFSGTPTVPGVYDIQVAITSYVTVLGGPITASDTISLYTFTVYPGITDTLATVDDCGIGVGSATASTNGMIPFTYLWSNGQTTPAATGLSAGGYNLILTDGDGCVDTLETVIGNNGAPELSLDTLGFVGCFGDMGGFVNVDIEGGSVPYGFSWSNGATTQNISGLSEDSYVLTLTDAKGCSVMETFNMEEPEEVVVELDGTEAVSCFGLADGLAEVTAGGGIGNYTYTWNTMPPQMGRVATGLDPGIWEVIAVDENGCTDTLEVEITTPDSLELMVSGTHETVSGANDGTANVMATGGTGMVTYSWSNGETGGTIDGLAPGTYIVEAEDENGCVTRDSVIIDMGPVSITGDLEAGFARLRAFPNPSNGQLTLDMALLNRQDITISLLDMTGHVLQVEQVENVDRYTTIWQLDQYAAGTYLIRISSMQGSVVRRLILMP